MSHADDLREVRELFPTAAAERSPYGNHWTYTVQLPGGDNMRILCGSPQNRRWRCELRGFVRGVGATAQEAYVAAREQYRVEMRTLRDLENLQMTWLDNHGAKFKETK